MRDRSYICTHSSLLICFVELYRRNYICLMRSIFFSMADQTKTHRRFQPRTEPYNVQTDAKLIRNSHRRRHDGFRKDLEKMDQNHRGAYGLTIISPELGFNRFNLSGLLSGFENTPVFNQFIADMHTYVTGREGKHRITSEERYVTSKYGVNEVLGKYKSTSRTKDALRVFLTNLATQDWYQPSWKSSHLTMEVMKAELLVVADLPALVTKDIWTVLVRISSKIKSHSDLLFIVQIIDAISHQRKESLLPVYPFESNSGEQIPTNLTTLVSTPEMIDSLAVVACNSILAPTSSFEAGTESLTA